MEGRGPELDLPGFRFHPTDVELLDFYLRRMVLGKELNFNVIGIVNIYRHDPWELPGLAKIGEREWYFFVPRDRRQSGGGRPNRTTERGYWKATGSDRHVRSSSDPKCIVGLKKTLVFYVGRAPRGSKTDWVMNEYRLVGDATSTSPISHPKEDMVLCKIYRKATSLKELEQRAAMEEEATASAVTSTPTSITDATSSSDADYNHRTSNNQDDGGSYDKEFATTKDVFFQEEEEEEESAEKETDMASPPTASMARSLNLTELEVPKHGMEWMQDPFLTQLRSPWLDQWSPYANLLNF